METRLGELLQFHQRLDPALPHIPVPFLRASTRFWGGTKTTMDIVGLLGLGAVKEGSGKRGKSGIWEEASRGFA